MGEITGKGRVRRNIQPYKQADLRLLPNSKGLVEYGEITFIHDMDGFRLEGVHNGKTYSVFMPSKGTYSCHIEYNYGKYKRDCVDLNTLNDSFWVFPRGEDFPSQNFSGYGRIVYLQKA